MRAERNDMIRKIEMDEALASKLEMLLEREMDDEFIYQAEGDGDDTYFAELVEIYKAILPKPRNAFEAIRQADLIDGIEEQRHKIYLRKMKVMNPNDDEFAGN